MRGFVESEAAVRVGQASYSRRAWAARHPVHLRVHDHIMVIIFCDPRSKAVSLDATPQDKGAGHTWLGYLPAPRSDGSSLKGLSCRAGPPQVRSRNSPSRAFESILRLPQFVNHHPRSCWHHCSKIGVSTLR